MTQPRWHTSAEFLAVSLALTTLYYLIRLPFEFLSLSYYDDFETLYHTLAILQGRVPYRDDFNHHFSGYLFPFILGARIFGFGLQLTHQVAAVNQVLVGLGTFVLVSHLVERRWAFLASVLAIGAREPWILGFFVQQELNLLAVVILIGSVRFLTHNSRTSLSIALFTCGIACTYDQRAILYLGIPFCAFLLGERKWMDIVTPLLPFFVAPFLALIYLVSNDALSPFLEQCFTFPTKYRIGSFSIWTSIQQGFAAHAPLFDDSLLLTGLSIVGFGSLLVNSFGKSTTRSHQLLVFVLPIFFILPMLGGRDYEYYSITWFPYLAILATFGMIHLKRSVNKAIFTGSIILVPLAIFVPSYLELLNLSRQTTSDGASEVVEILKTESASSDTLFVWGYRLDIYVALGKLAPNPFGSLIFVEPDSAMPVHEREKHIFPKYQERLFDSLKNYPPKFFVLFERGERPSTISHLPELKSYGSCRRTITNSLLSIALTVSVWNVAGRFFGALRSERLPHPNSYDI